MFHERERERERDQKLEMDLCVIFGTLGLGLGLVLLEKVMEKRYPRDINARRFRLIQMEHLVCYAFEILGPDKIDSDFTQPVQFASWYNS